MERDGAGRSVGASEPPDGDEGAGVGVHVRLAPWRRRLCHLYLPLLVAIRATAGVHAPAGAPISAADPEGGRRGKGGKGREAWRRSLPSVG